MRGVFLFSLLLASASLSAQTVEQWWLPVTRPGFRYLEPTLHPVPGGMVCMTFGDSVQNVPGQSAKKVWWQLCFHFIDEAGALQSIETKVIGPYPIDDLGGESGSFDYAVGYTGSGGILLASTSWNYRYSCTGGTFLSAGRLRVDYFRKNGFRVVSEFSSGRNPVLLSAVNGEAWLAFEQVETIEQPRDTLDARYRARVVVARISADNRMLESRVLGEGYEPKLVERSDGEILVLFRTGEHSAALHGIGLTLQEVGHPAGASVRLAEGLNRRYYYRDVLTQAVAGSDGQMYVACGIDDSLIVHRVSTDLQVQEIGRTEAYPGYGFQLILEADGTPLVLWHRRISDPVQWSRMVGDRLFGTIRSIPESERLGDRWIVLPGADNRLAFASFHSPQRLFRLNPNFTETAWAGRALFLHPDSLLGIRDWILEPNGTLWGGYLKQDGLGHPLRMGVFRVRDLSLPASTPPSLPGSAQLLGNYPNPFTTFTTLRVSLPQTMPVTLTVTDVLGREVRRICDGQSYPAGQHAFPFDATTLPPGVYFTRLRTADRLHIGRMVVTR